MGSVVACVTAYQAHLEFKRMIDEVEDDEPTITKCPACGSHQFVMHANRRICSYCRSKA